ncbi:MAG: hypothetical protein WCJ30_29675, partial [Deltaproteobacteria bacterium]
MPRRASSRPAAIVALALLGSCVKPRPYVVDEIARPVHVRLMVDYFRREFPARWRPGLAVLGDGYSVVVRCQHEFTTPVPAGRTPGLLAMDSSGARLAVRCATSDGWTVYVHAREDSFAMCPDPARTGVEVPWSTVANVEDAAIAAVQCGTTDLPAAVRAIERLRGAAGLGRFVRTMVLRGVANGGDVNALAAANEALVRALARIPPEDRAAVRASMRDVLVNGADPMRTSRALLLVDLRDGAFTREVLGAALVRCGVDTRNPGCDALLRRYATIAPLAAARSVCNVAASVSDFDLGALRVAVLAQAGERCEAWAARQEGQSCSTLVGGRSCPSSAGT